MPWFPLSGKPDHNPVSKQHISPNAGEEIKGPSWWWWVGFFKNLELSPGLVQYVDKYLGPAQGRGQEQRGQEQRVAWLLPTATWMHHTLNQSWRYGMKHPAQAGMRQPQQIPTSGLHWVGLQLAWTTRTSLNEWRGSPSLPSLRQQAGHTKPSLRKPHGGSRAADLHDSSPSARGNMSLPWMRCQ